MRQRLRAAVLPVSPERALASLRRIHHHWVQLDVTPRTGVSSVTEDQAALLRDLILGKPRMTEQLSLL